MMPSIITLSPLYHGHNHHNQGDNGGIEVTPGITNALPTLSQICKVGVEDKIQQVFFSTIALMDAVLFASRRAKMPRSVVAPLFDPVVTILIEKLADGNARIREGARKGLEVLAGSGNVGTLLSFNYNPLASPPCHVTPL